MKRKSPVAFLTLVLLATFGTCSTVGQSPAAPTDESAQQAIASADISKSRETPSPSEGQRYYDAGVRLYDSEKFAEAVDALKEATRISPSDAQAHFMLGMSEARLQLYKQSAESFRRAVRVRPDWAEAQFRLGIVSHVSGRRDLATQAYTTLLKLNLPLARILFRVISDENRGGGIQDVGDKFWSYKEKSQRTDEPVANTATSKLVRPTDTDSSTANRVLTNIPPTTPAAANKAPANDPSLSNIYRIGVGDVLDIRLLNAASPRSTLYTVLEGGLIDYPIAGGTMSVAGLTTDELQLNIATELKRRAVEEGARVTVGVRQYASHAVSVTGLVSSPGTRFLRREAVPLYVIMAESQVRQDAGRVTIIRSGSENVLDLTEPSALNFLIRPGDLISVAGRPQQFYYIGGRVNYPGQKVFQSGITLLQALLAAGGASRPGNNVVEISRENGAGHLGTTKFSLKEIKSGKIPDPKLQPGDRIDVLK